MSDKRSDVVKQLRAPRTAAECQEVIGNYQAECIRNGKPPRAEPPAGWLANLASCVGCSLAGAWPVLLVLLVVGVSGWQRNTTQFSSLPLPDLVGAAGAVTAASAASLEVDSEEAQAASTSAREDTGEAGLAPTTKVSRFSAFFGKGGDALAPALPPAPAPYAAYLASHARAGVDCAQAWELIVAACMRWADDNPDLPPPDPAVLLVLAAHESELRTWAVGSHGERGLLQVHPDHDAGMRSMGLDPLSEPDRLLFALYLYHWHGWQPWSVRRDAQADLKKLQATSASTREEGNRAKGQGPRGER